MLQTLQRPAVFGGRVAAKQARLVTAQVSRVQSRLFNMSAGGFEEVDVKTAHDMTVGGGGWAYVDVRTEVEYSDGHAPGSLHIPLHLGAPGPTMQDNPGFGDAVKQAFPDKDTKLVMG